MSAQTDVLCNGASTGSATVTPSGGNPSYTYEWAPSGGTAATASGLAAGTYTVTVTDANGCQKTATVSITQPTALVASISTQTNVLCNGASTGSATVTVSGGNPLFSNTTAPLGGTATITTNVSPTYIYSWAPSGGTAATATGLSAGTYTVTVTDANACQKTATVNITQPAALVASISAQTNVICNGASTGSATVTASGGNPNYTYSWAPSGGTAATASGLAAGIYTVTVTDANGCQKTATVNNHAAYGTRRICFCSNECIVQWSKIQDRQR
ncbi:SprB repeat-containing protein [Lacihabitans soyangensis]|uniref:SprB repeat-containing protein n=1 Tax=Lacihabitans soyangensis TaxID=869394 RepID=UPI0020CC971A|nr:SprB repeat-containing protein [Lacihabitans soyangensis]